MSIQEQILKDVKEALKNREDLKLRALRLVQAELKNLEIQKKPTPIEDKDVVDLLRKQIKKYKELIQELVEAGRSAEAEEEITQSEYLKSYLPPEMSSEELKQIIKDSIESLKAKSLKDQGLVIKEVQKRVKGRADNVQIVQLVRQHLLLL